MTQIAKGFTLAVSMLTIIPFFKVHNFYKGINGYAVMFYPFVGFLLGLILWGFFLFLQNSLPITHLSIIIFSLLVLLTGAIHLDGFSDTVDGLFVSKDKSLSVMKDPNIGGMGMIFSVVFLLLKASTFVSIFAQDTNLVYLLPIILMLSRFNAVVAIYFYPYISKKGMGSLAKEELTFTQVALTSAYVSFLTLLFYKISLIFISLSILAMLAIFFMRRYNGFTGDIYGFSIEFSELVLLNFILWN